LFTKGTHEKDKKFRTANWAGIKSDLQFSGILGLFPMLELQN
jgi:hypothetical protein